jgi:DNA-binding PadR family transcriptional regulator
VLLLLADEPMHGYQLMQTIGERTGGRWRPSPGAVYPTLSQLEDEGLVSSQAEGGRKLMTLTEAGRAHVAEHSASWPDPFPAAAQDEESQDIDLRELGHGLLGAAREVARSGTDEQVREVARLLEETRRRIYRILAGEPRSDEQQ